VEKYLTGREILGHYKLRPFQFLELIGQGLAPHEAASGRPLPFLTEPEFWLYRVERVLWASAGLLLTLFDSAPPTGKLTPDILAQMPRLYHRALSRLAASKPPDTKLYEFKPEGRLARRKMIRFEAWLLSSIISPNTLTKEYPLTAALFQAACPQTYACLFDLAVAFSNSANPPPERIDDLEDEFAFDAMDRLINEQSRGSFIDHALLGKLLTENLPALPLADFCQDYPRKSPGYSKYRHFEDLEQMEGSTLKSSRYVETSLRKWAKLDNSQRLLALSQFSRMVRGNFPSTPLPLWPKNAYIGLVLLPEEFERLKEAAFKAEELPLLEYPKPEEQPSNIINIFTSVRNESLNNNIAVVNTSNTHIEVEGNTPQPDNPPPADQTQVAEDDQASSDITLGPSPNKKIKPNHRESAANYRALKTKAKNKKQELALEAMARKIEGQQNWQIFRELGFEKTNLMVELEIQIKKGEPERRSEPERQLRQRQREKISKFINKYGEPFAKKHGLDWPKDNPDSPESRPQN
jgi:hypothetical protein